MVTSGRRTPKQTPQKYTYKKIGTSFDRSLARGLSQCDRIGLSISTEQTCNGSKRKTLARSRQRNGGRAPGSRHQWRSSQKAGRNLSSSDNDREEGRRLLVQLTLQVWGGIRLRHNGDVCDRFLESWAWSFKALWYVCCYCHNTCT